MTDAKKTALRLVFSFVLLYLAGSPAHAAADAIALLSADSQPYEEALTGCRDAYGRSISTITMSTGKVVISSHTHVLVAFGSKAALKAAGTSDFTGVLVYALAPGLKIPSQKTGARLINVETSPAVPVVVAKFREIQPSLRRLAVL